MKVLSTLFAVVIVAVPGCETLKSSNATPDEETRMATNYVALAQYQVLSGAGCALSFDGKWAVAASLSTISLVRRDTGAIQQLNWPAQDRVWHLHQDSAGTIWCIDNKGTHLAKLDLDRQCVGPAIKVGANLVAVSSCRSGATRVVTSDGRIAAYLPDGGEEWRRQMPDVGIVAASLSENGENLAYICEEKAIFVDCKTGSNRIEIAVGPGVLDCQISADGSCAAIYQMGAPAALGQKVRPDRLMLLRRKGDTLCVCESPAGSEFSVTVFCEGARSPTLWAIGRSGVRFVRPPDCATRTALLPVGSRRPSEKSSVCIVRDEFIVSIGDSTEVWGRATRN